MKIEHRFISELCCLLSVIMCCSVQFSSVAQSCPTLCDPMNHSTPGLPVHPQLLECTQTHVHWVGDTIQPSHSVVPFSSHLQSFPASGSFQMSQFFASGGQSIGVLAPTSVLPMTIQDWFPLGIFVYNRPEIFFYKQNHNTMHNGWYVRHSQYYSFY